MRDTRPTIATAPHSITIQCSIPAFEGLFPGDHDGRVQDLLYSMAYWHSFAKLRMHTDLSLDILESWTSTLGEDARAFVSLTCAEFKTRELEKEYEARKRAEGRRKSKSTKTLQQRSQAMPASGTDDAGKGSHSELSPCIHTQYTSNTIPSFSGEKDATPALSNAGSATDGKPLECHFSR